MNVTSAEKTILSESPTFVLLRDFFHAYDYFDLKVPGIDDRLRTEVIAEMDAVLNRHCSTVIAYSLEEILSLTSPLLNQGYFVVTMDGGTYFRGADFYIEITRACLQIDEIKGPKRHVTRVPREAAGVQLNTQILRLKKHYERYGGTRPIMLCDDGIGTGGTARRTIELFGEFGLNIERIVVLLNPSGRSSIEDVDVTPLLSPSGDFIWLSERDLYWGLPRSGSSLIPAGGHEPRHGVPYTFDRELVIERIGLSDGLAGSFRREALAVNEIFLEMLEKGHARTLALADCGRLKFVADVLADQELRVIDFIRSISYDEFELHRWLHDVGYLR